jgi:hypothetical protein
MQNRTVTLRDGTIAKLFKSATGLWACPICGSAELKTAPYYDDGGASFEMCSCGFEFGFDDDPGASADAVESVQGNWEHWRKRFLSKLSRNPLALAEVVKRLREINVHVVGNDSF